MIAPTDEQLHALWAHCRKFIEDQDISFPECVYQSDNVILNAYEFIAGACDIVGYHECEEE